MTSWPRRFTNKISKLVKGILPRWRLHFSRNHHDRHVVQEEIIEPIVEKEDTQLKLRRRPSFSYGFTVTHGTTTYTFRHEIGHGAHGWVWSACETDRDPIYNISNVAIKAIRKAALKLDSVPLSADTNFKDYAMTAKQLMNELAIMRRIPDKCPFLVKQLNVFQDQQYCYMVTRLYPESLAGRLSYLVNAEEMMPLHQIRQYAFELAIALYELAKYDILHFDIKPDNIMLSHRGHAVLIDFGLAEHYAYNAPPQPDVRPDRGTPGYQMPFLAKTVTMSGRRINRRHADRYSYAVVLFEMLMCPLPIFNSKREIVGTWKDCRQYDPLVKNLVDNLMYSDEAAWKPANSDYILKDPFFEELDVAKATKKLYKPTYEPQSMYGPGEFKASETQTDVVHPQR